MDTQLWLIIIQACAAVATLALAAVAVWGNWFKAKFAGPILTIELHDEQGELTKRSDGRPARYFHLKVSNQRNWSPAQNVVVVVRKVDNLLETDQWDTVFEGKAALHWQKRIEPFLPTIGSYKLCDLGFVTKDEQFELSIQNVRPEKLGGVLKVGEKLRKLRVHVVAESDNVESDQLCFEIAWDGNWHEVGSEMTKHLSIQQQTPP